MLVKKYHWRAKSSLRVSNCCCRYFICISFNTANEFVKFCLSTSLCTENDSTFLIKFSLSRPHIPNTIPGRPFVLQNCTVSNQSIETIYVECMEGYDGGLPQMFLLEMVEIPSLKLVRNLTLYVSV